MVAGVGLEHWDQVGRLPFIEKGFLREGSHRRWSCTVCPIPVAVTMSVLREWPWGAE